MSEEPRASVAPGSPGASSGAAGGFPVSRGETALAALLLVIFGALAVHSMRIKSPTFDETTHLPSGISYVQTHDFRMNPEHPALPKQLAGWSATLFSGVVVDTATSAWRGTEQWDFGRDVLYRSGTDWRRIVFGGRLPMVAIGMALGAVIWLWARALLGGAGAFVALVLYAFSPNFLAHARLVTTDVPLTFTVVGAVAALWAARETGRVRWVLVAATFVGLSMVTKFSAFSYAPVYLVLVLLPSPARPGGKTLAHLAIFAIASLACTELLIAASYASLEPTSIRSLGLAGRGVTPESMGLLRRIPYELIALVPWPSADYAEGLKDVILHTESGHPVFLLGKRAEEGWWWSSFVALAVKTPLPLIVLSFVALGFVVRRPALRRADLLFLFLPAALVLATNVVAKLGLGYRHLLPMIPFLTILAAWPLRGRGFPGGAFAAGGLGALLLLQVVETAIVHPHYIPYFHSAVGGARNGYRILGDSNLDWGQDLSLAADRLRERGARGAILCYFGTADPFAEPLDWQLLPPAQRGKENDPWVVLGVEGPQWLLMSATNRQGIYYRVPGGGLPYPWLEGVEPVEVVGGSIFLYEIGRNADVQSGLAETYRRHGLRDEADAALRRVLVKRKFDSQARRDLVASLLARGDSTAVEEVLAGAPNPGPDEVIQLATIRRALGDVDGAIHMYELGLHAFKTDSDFKNSYAWFLQEMDRDLERALEVVNEAIEWTPEDPYFRDTRAVIRRKLGDSEAALADLDEALTLPGGDLPEVRWHRVQVLADLGRKAEAVREAEALLSRSPSPALRSEVEAWLSGSPAARADNPLR